jgi:precorrin-2/cobalt-factor-2 C20-methyltransferase
MTTGKLYGVGVGPGDPQLLTLKAASVIGACPVVAAPQTKTGTTALDIARGAVSLEGKTILSLDFAMSLDKATREASHRVAAEKVRAELSAGRDVAFLNLGDISIYASFHYIWDLLKPGGFAMEMIPGVTSFCAAAAELGISLTDIDTDIRIIPNGGSTTDNGDGRATKIWMKSGRRLTALLEDLHAAGRLPDTMLVQNCGMRNQRVYPRLDSTDVATDYFSIVILKQEGRGQ